MPTDNVERKLTAILSADAQGYSRLMGEDGLTTSCTLITPQERYYSGGSELRLTQRISNGNWLIVG
jgi:hypothetical protein